MTSYDQILYPVCRTSQYLHCPAEGVKNIPKIQISRPEQSARQKTNTDTVMVFATSNEEDLYKTCTRLQSRFLITRMTTPSEYREILLIGTLEEAQHHYTWGVPCEDGPRRRRAQGPHLHLTSAVPLHGLRGARFSSVNIFHNWRDKNAMDPPGNLLIEKNVR